MQELIVIAIMFASLAFATESYWRARQLRNRLAKKEKELKQFSEDTGRRMYELSILKEIGDRVSYSLDVRQIVDIITGSLHQFIEYSMVSYMLLEPEKILFNVHLEKSVPRSFVDDVRSRMLKSLSALLEKEFSLSEIKEVLSGAILAEYSEDPVRSFFNIPIVIGDKVVGMLTIAHSKAGLYKEDEMTILYKITSQASQAVTKLQDVVRTEESKLNAMVESMDDGVVMTDMDFRLMVINPAAKRVIGLPLESEATIFEFITRLGDKFDIRGHVEESIKLSKSFVSDKILIGEKFYQFFVSPVLHATVSKGQEVLGSVVIFHDVTGEVELETMRKEFTSLIVHELRSPLDTIKKISELERGKDIKLTPVEHEDYMHMIYSNSSSMLELVNDLLDLSKLEAGKFEIHPAPANMQEIVDNRVKFYSITAKDSHITLKSVYDPRLPAEIVVDSDSIKQVLNNLLSNAIKFTPENGEVSVVSFLHERGHSLRDESIILPFTWPIELPGKDVLDFPKALVVAVVDNGIGIREGDIGKLFNKFKQLKQRSTAKIKGTGLGLSIAKGIVEEHRGQISVVSKEGAGTIFFFIVPLE